MFQTILLAKELQVGRCIRIVGLKKANGNLILFFLDYDGTKS